MPDQSKYDARSGFPAVDVQEKHSTNQAQMASQLGGLGSAINLPRSSIRAEIEQRRRYLIEQLSRVNEVEKYLNSQRDVEFHYNHVRNLLDGR